MKSSGPISKIKNRFKTSKKLRDIIREVRLCKTAADERAYVQKECAVIRDFFREENSLYRCRNVAKLLYFYMLGYPAHFGQMECLKLIVSENFGDKRMGYLGIMLLLDDKQDVQLLITNSLKHDLSSTSSPYIVGMAITTLANICSVDVTRDIASSVEELMKSGDPYIRKKAALCAVRMVRIVPQMVDIFNASVFALLEDKNHGVQVAGTSLLIEIMKSTKKYANLYKPCVTILIRNLSALVRSVSYATEYQIGGITDPFLQIKIIEALRVLGKSGNIINDKMIDVLTEVLTHTDTANSNIGNAVLYEAVITIIDLNVSPDLRTLAINILGRFLVHIDSNIRYIALNSLLSVVNVDYKSVQRHRSTIMDSLKEGGEIIKRRAMELSFALINKNTVKSIVAELIVFMNTNNQQLKSDCASGIILVSERHATDKKWYFQTVTEVLAKAGDAVRDDVVSSFIQMLSESTELQTYATYLLFIEATSKTVDFGNPNCKLVITAFNPLLKITSWTIGEYGDLLLEEQDSLLNHEPTNSLKPQRIIKEWHLIKFIQNVLSSNSVSDSAKNFSLTSALKLTSRLSQNNSSHLYEIISIFKKSRAVELQQRSLEYNKIVSQYESIKDDLLERLPILPRKIENEINNELVNGESDNLNLFTNDVSNSVSTSKRNDLIDIFDSLPKTSIDTITKNNDIMNLFDTLSTTPKNNEPNINSLNFLNENSAPLDTAKQVYTNSHGVTVKFNADSTSTKVFLKMFISNTSFENITDFQLKIAVPKNISVELGCANSSNLMKNLETTIEQSATISNPQCKKVRVRIRMNYVYKSEQLIDQFDYDQF